MTFTAIVDVSFLLMKTFNSDAKVSAVSKGEKLSGEIYSRNTNHLSDIIVLKLSEPQDDFRFAKIDGNYFVMQ